MNHEACRNLWPIVAIVFGLQLSFGGVAIADPLDLKDGKSDSGCKDCAPPKEICFNLVCSYQREGSAGGYEKCEAAARFKKLVSAGGKEVWDQSEADRYPEFEVQCDQYMLFNNSALRYTDSLGTRIQGRTGPYPAILLPRHALKEGHGYVPSSLELSDQHLRGYCYVYTGPQ